MRRIFFDTETTGVSVRDGHKIIDIACVETIDFKKTGRVFQAHINPEREIDEAATRIHGKTLEMLLDKPKFPEIADDFLTFIEGAELIAHNASFDVSFINYELSLAGRKSIENEVTDSLQVARKYYVGEPASLDALCKKFAIDNSGRTHHGALLDSDLLCDVFTKILEDLSQRGVIDYKIKKEERATSIKRNTKFAFRKFAISEEEMAAHKEFLKSIGF